MSAELDSAMNSANTLVDMCGKLLAERDSLEANLAEALEIGMRVSAENDRLKALNAELVAALRLTSSQLRQWVRTYGEDIDTQDAIKAASAAIRKTKGARNEHPQPHP